MDLMGLSSKEVEDSSCSIHCLCGGCGGAETRMPPIMAGADLGYRMGGLKNSWEMLLWYLGEQHAKFRPTYFT
jgi:hypothetical protein